MAVKKHTLNTLGAPKSRPPSLSLRGPARNLRPAAWPPPANKNKQWPPGARGASPEQNRLRACAPNRLAPSLHQCTPGRTSRLHCNSVSRCSPRGALQTRRRSSHLRSRLPTVREPPFFCEVDQHLRGWQPSVFGGILCCYALDQCSCWHECCCLTLETAEV